MFSKRTTSDWQLLLAWPCHPERSEGSQLQNLGNIEQSRKEGVNSIAEGKTTADTRPPVYEARTSPAGEF
jgi:hypothetical protein